MKSDLLSAKQRLTKSSEGVKRRQHKEMWYSVAMGLAMLYDLFFMLSPYYYFTRLVSLCFALSKSHTFPVLSKLPGSK